MGLGVLMRTGGHRQYGVGQDWATVLVERLSGQNMQDYCTEHIFKPLGMNSSCFDAHMPPAVSALLSFFQASNPLPPPTNLLTSHFPSPPPTSSPATPNSTPPTPAA